MSSPVQALTDAPSVAPHQAIYRRWRAQTFSQIVGQAAVVTTLRNGVRLERVAHGLLFVGPRGTGKTSMARIVAKAVNCTDLRDGDPCDTCPSCTSIRDGRALDVVEMDAASNNRVDDMRELLPRVYTAPSDLRRKVFIVDEVQRIKEGWDVLLKTLEEPPDDVVFIFCTTNPAGIRPAVVSRLQRYTFRPLTIPEITGKLGRILEGEGRTAEPAAVALVAELAAGGMRDAESMLDQLLSTASDPLTLADVRELLGLADTAAVDTFVDALAGIDPLAGIAVLEALEENGRDLVAFADQVVARLREALVSRLRGDPGPTSGTSGPSAAALAQAARRLSALDTARVGAGGYRFQLELAVLQTTTVQSTPADRPTSERSPSERPISDPEPVSAESSPPEIAPAQTNPLPDLAPAQPNGRPRPADSPVDAPRTLPTPAQTPEPPAPAAAGSPLDQLRRSWPDVVAHVARNPANRPLITACRPVEVEGHVVVLGFPEDQAFLRDIAERKRTALEEAVQLVLGPAYGVRCIATNLEALPPLPEAETIDLVEHARRIFGGDIADVAEVS